MTIIRPVVDDDLEALREMIFALSAFHGDVAEVTIADLQRDVLGDNPWVQVLMAQCDDGLIGYAGLLPHGSLHRGKRAMDLHHLFVVKRARGTGVGQALINASAKLAKSLQCATLWVGTDPNNTHAQMVYEAYGFERVDYAAPKFKLALT